MMKPPLLLLAFITFLFGCEDSIQEDKSELDGLWIVESVKVGDEEMTPNARWTRLNSDSTFESGNGKFEHSHGTWKHDAKSHELSFFKKMVLTT